jgi:hypothetical protein
VSNVLRSGGITDPRERRGNGIEPAAVTTQHNPTCASEPRGDAAAANDHSRAPRAKGARALSLDTMDEYAAELAEVGRLLRDGAFKLWSCETAHGKRNSNFVDALAHATELQIAASTQLVGAAANDAAGAPRATRH